MAETALLISPRRRWWKIRGVEFITTHQSPFPPTERHLAMLDEFADDAGVEFAPFVVRACLIGWGFTVLCE